MTGTKDRAVVRSSNNFPTGAGLASSASGFAALVTAAAAALELDLSPRELSIIARQGSGSAARSIFGGFVEMHAGAAEDGSDSFAEPLLAAGRWPLEVVIAVTTTAREASRFAQRHDRSAQASPYYPAWVATHPADLDIARDAIRRRDFAALAEVAEHNCLKMHAAAIAARPPLLYWNAATLQCLTEIQKLRREGAAGVLHDRCRSPSQGDLRAARASVRWSERCGPLPGVLRSPHELARTRRGAARVKADRCSSAGQARGARRVRRARRRARDRVGGRPLLRGDARVRAAMTAAICYAHGGGGAPVFSGRGNARDVALVDLVSSASQVHAWIGNARFDRVLERRQQARFGLERGGAHRLGRRWHAYAAAVGVAVDGPDLDGLDRSAPAIPGRPRQWTRCCGKPARRRDRISPRAARRASCWFSPAPEQCRIRGYFCRSLCFDAGIARPLSGFSRRSAEAGGRGAAPAALDRGSRMRGCSRGRCRRVHDGDREYGRGLEDLGVAIGAEIVTAEHRQVRSTPSATVWLTK